jgi:hypothetical protein
MFEDFKGIVNMFHNDDKFNSMPMWISEIGCHVRFLHIILSKMMVESISLQEFSSNPRTCDAPALNALYSAVVSFVESTSFIEKYAWFGEISI